MTGPDHALPLLIVVGMRSEARIVRGAGRVLVGLEGLQESLTRGTAGVISFGLCGGLDPALAAGDLVIGAGVMGPTGLQACDPAWTASLRRRLPGATVGNFAAAPQIFAHAADKSALRRTSGAGAVDIESPIVATYAARAKIPFAILRCVSDAADRTLPAAAVAAFGKGGEIAYGAMLAALARRPAQLPALIATAREAGAALRALRDARDLLGPGLGCPYLGKHLIDMA
jgi:hypothetical protein